MSNWRAYVVPALFLALLCALGLSYFEGRKAGEYAVRLHTADSAIVVLLKRVPKTDTLFVHDSVTNTVVRHRTDTVLRVDTLWRSDTVRALIATERQACDAVVSSCEQKVAIRDTLIAAQNAKIQLLLHKPGAPRFPSCVAGAGIGTAGKFELSVTCGVRLH